MIRNAIHSCSKCITTKYVDNENFNTVETVDKEITFKLFGTRIALEKISRITINNKYSMQLDWGTHLIQHPTGHSDPLFFIEDEVISLPFILYDLSICHSPSEDLFVHVVTTDGQEFALDSKYHDEYSYDDEDTFTSSFDINTNILSVNSSSSCEVIFQYSHMGHFSEDRHKLEPGSHTLSLPYNSAEYYGIAVSSNHEVGGLEHKHMVMGHLGNGSGKYFISHDGFLHEPRGTFPYSLKSLLCVVCDEEFFILENLGDLLNKYREIEFALDLDNLSNLNEMSFKKKIELLPEDVSNRVSYFTFKSNEEVIEITKGDASYVSYTFAINAKSVDLFDRLKKAHISEANNLFEKSWTSNLNSYPSHGQNFGIGYSYFRSNDLYEQDSVFSRTRKILSSSPCSSCDFLDVCDALLPNPFSKDIMRSDYHFKDEDGISCNLAEFLRDNI